MIPSYEHGHAPDGAIYTWAVNRSLPHMKDFLYMGGYWHGFPYPMTETDADDLCALYDELWRAGKNSLGKERE